MARITTKKALAKSLKERMLEKSFAKISTEDICQGAGISKRNFYRYFADKYELLSWIYEDEYFSKLVAHDDWVIWDYFPGVCEYCYNDRAFFRKAVQIEGQNSPRVYWRQALTPLICHDFEDTYLTDKSAAFYIEKETDALFDYMQEWIKSEPCMPPDEFAAFIRESVYKHAKRVVEIAGKNIK